MKSADCSTNFDFFPRKPREIGQFFREFAPENPAKFCFFLPRNIRSPGYVKEKLDDGHFQGSHVSCKRNGTLYDNKPFFSFGGI